MTSPFDRSSTRPPVPSQGWEATRVQTQIATRLFGSDDGPGERDIGKPVGNDTRELFVACEPAEAMGQQFDHLRPDYVAVHDLGTSASRKLLAGIAAASREPVQKLVIRRPGGGIVLATIEFVDCPASDGHRVRLYCSSVDADTQSRQALSRVLLARSQVGVVLVGDLPAHALASALEPWQIAVRQGGWSCRRLLFMPLAGGAALSSEITRFRAVTSLDCTPTPRVTRPAEVWTYLCSAWNLLQRSRHPGLDGSKLPLLGTPAAGTSGPMPLGSPSGPMPLISMPMPLVSAPAPLSSAPMPLASAPAPLNSAPAPLASAPAARVSAPAPLASEPVPLGSAPAPLAATSAPIPMPVVGAAPPPRDAPLERWLHDLGQLGGVVSACAFDTATGVPLGHAGSRPGPDELARHGNNVHNALLAASRALGLGVTPPEATVTLGQHHLLLRPVPGHPGMALHVVLDKPHATLALVLVQLRRLDEELLAATERRAAASVG